MTGNTPGGVADTVEVVVQIRIESGFKEELKLENGMKQSTSQTHQGNTVFNKPHA